MRPTGASFRPTEYPTFFVKIETQAHTFHKATPWARCRVWLQRSTPQQFAAQGRLANGRDSRHRLCLLSDKGARFPTVDCPRAASGARPRARARALMPAEPPLICRTRSHAPEPGTTRIQPQACTNFGTSTSTGLDSHVASNCRFGEQVATASEKSRRRPVPRRGESHDAATHVPIAKPRLAAQARWAVARRIAHQQPGRSCEAQHF